MKDSEPFSNLRNSQQVTAHLLTLGSEEMAVQSRRFFKTGEGEYAETEQFIGVRVPVLRKLAKQLQNISLPETSHLLESPYHEARHLALFMLVNRYQRGGSDERTQIFETYLAHTSYINNWDLVDASAYRILGPHLYRGDRTLLFDFAQSENMWERRIAIISTLYFIKQNDYGDTFRLAEMLITDPEDLIHKAAGWMLREVGKRDKPSLDEFLKFHHRRMPRTMLRYAIEKHPEDQRQGYLKGLV